MRAADERTDLRVLGQRVADGECLRLLGKGRCERVVRLVLHEDPRARLARLAGRVVDRPQRADDGRVEVGVGEDDVRALAAELQRDALERLGGNLGDAAAGIGLAGEGDLVDAGMGGDRLTHLGTGTGDDVQHPGRDAGLERELPEPERRERGGRCGLEDHRVPGRERGRDLPGGHHQRVVPRDDRADHPDRLAQRVAHHRRVDDVGPPVQVLRGAGEQLERGDGDLDLGGALPLRLAVVAALELGEGIGLLVEQLGEPVERPRSLGR